MGNYSLVTCLKDSENSVKKPGFLGQVYNFFQNTYKWLKIKDKLKQGVRKLEIYENKEDCYDSQETFPKAYCITIPLHLSELEGLGTSRLKRIETLIKDFCLENNISIIILPKTISQKCKFNNLPVGVFKGRSLFRALLPNILDEIYTKRGIKIRDLDIAIVQGKSHEELFFFIRLLAPMLKYLTVIAEDKEEIEKQAEGIYEESGLSVRVTKDRRSGLKDARLVLNLGELTEGMKIDPRAVVVNYGSIQSDMGISQNLLLNGIDIKLPSAVATRVEKSIFDYFTNYELAEIIISHKLGIENNILSNETGSPDIYLSMHQEFCSSAYSIAGLIGRRSILKMRDINIYTGKTLQKLDAGRER